MGVALRRRGVAVVVAHEVAHASPSAEPQQHAARGPDGLSRQRNVGTDGRSRSRGADGRSTGRAAIHAATGACGHGDAGTGPLSLGSVRPGRVHGPHVRRLGHGQAKRLGALLGLAAAVGRCGNGRRHVERHGARELRMGPRNDAARPPRLGAHGHGERLGRRNHLRRRRWRPQRARTDRLDSGLDWRPCVPRPGLDEGTDRESRLLRKDLQEPRQVLPCARQEAYGAGDEHLRGLGGGR
mmetsp:Transcript_12196/g.35034  ORF Transcript_12196/g.35034 Transcript_12196/m.35034 type:complete len:240 (+) Transcript_12196:627-1346(+)